ncbi:DUF4258 domain-containing protein [candidate division CSSED10-310 bacterium]|uniref:DUF4258 domain-containing protein n=1 Tax=candidate division CSSED10-310 bacterium TaxID=2855610 RepID=A0ABV6Z342_UNCC1
MHKKILDQIKDKVRNHEFIITNHAFEEMIADDLSVYDIELGILSGELIERQKNEFEWKYVIKGRTSSNEAVFVITKISITDKVIVVTVFLDW